MNKPVVVTAWKAQDGKLFLYEDEAKKHDEKCARYRRQEKLDHLLGVKKCDDAGQYVVDRMIEYWDKVKEIMDG